MKITLILVEGLVEHNNFEEVTLNWPPPKLVGEGAGSGQGTSRKIWVAFQMLINNNNVRSADVSNMGMEI